MNQYHILRDQLEEHTPYEITVRIHCTEREISLLFPVLWNYQVRKNLNLRNCCEHSFCSTFKSLLFHPFTYIERNNPMSSQIDRTTASLTTCSWIILVTIASAKISACTTISNVPLVPHITTYSSSFYFSTAEGPADLRDDYQPAQQSVSLTT